MASKKIAYELLMSRDLKVFWDDIRRMREASMRKLLKEEDMSCIKEVKTIDRILALPELYKKS